MVNSNPIANFEVNEKPKWCWWRQYRPCASSKCDEYKGHRIIHSIAYLKPFFEAIEKSKEITTWLNAFRHYELE
jgi:hypothetical protein